jgi:hypothetical protein
VSREDFNRSLVDGLANALNDHDLTRARTYLADDLRFVGVFGPPIEGADADPSVVGLMPTIAKR